MPTSCHFWPVASGEVQAKGPEQRHQIHKARVDSSFFLLNLESTRKLLYITDDLGWLGPPKAKEKAPPTQRPLRQTGEVLRSWAIAARIPPSAVPDHQIHAFCASGSIGTAE